MTRIPADSAVPRRAFLKAAAAASLAAGVPRLAFGADGAVPGVADYLAGLRRPDGGYGWGDGTRSHLTATFAAIGCHRLLGLDPPGKAAVAAFLRTHHPFAMKRLEREIKAFEYQQIQGLLWLGEEAGEFEAPVRNWKEPFAYPIQYETHGYPVFEYEAMDFVCRRLLGLPTDDIAPATVAYLDSRRRPDGSFNNTPADDGSGGHVLNTWWGLQALDSLGRAEERREETVRWVRGCQLPGGGFTWSPEPFMAGTDDAAYAWAAVRIFERLGAAPARPDACRDHLLGLRAADGGFAPRLGWDSNPVATYYVLDSLRALGALEAAKAGPKSPVGRRPRPSIPDDLGVYTIQIEAPGKGSPAEAVDLARSLKIHLWGAKNAAPGWTATAQAIADRVGVPVTFFVANEEYGTLVTVPGQGTYSHTSDLVAPAGAEIGPPLSGAGAVAWEEFRTRRLDPLRQAGGRLVWQFGENEALTRLYLDDSLARGGYAAISTFHFGNPDFANSSPFLRQYAGRIPFVALQDAHGDESWWWGDQLAGFRTLFVAREPTWDGWLDALANGRVAAVRRDAASRGETWTHGPPEVLAFADARPAGWRWWNDAAVARPPVSVVAVRPEDRFEAARPERGVTVRVRCDWENTTQGRPKSPRVELVRLRIDGREVPTTLAAPGPKSRPTDHYRFHHLTDPARGEHAAVAVFRRLDTGEEGERMVLFRV